MDEVLGLTKLFNGNRHTTVPAEVRRKLGISRKGNFKVLWLFNKDSERIYIRVSKPTLGSYDTQPWPR